MDIEKLKYDLAMQCTLVELLKEQSPASESQDGQIKAYDIRISVLEHFESYYEYFKALDDSRFEHLKNID